MKDFLHHLFIPRESNNYRTRLLHSQSLVFVIILFFLFQVTFSAIKQNYQNVLGASTNISPTLLLSVTNSDREKEGLSPLTINETLSNAARLKAENMFANNYWAHNAPDGTQPWFFIKNAGYEYVYAGENLARGFSTSEDVVNAWMNSPSHRENMLSKNYQDVGFAVVEGKLLGEDTTLVVEMFGSTKQTVLAKKSNVLQVTPQLEPASVPVKEVAVQAPAPVTIKPMFDSFVLARYMSMTTVLFFIGILFIDMIIIERKKIVRLVGHNLDHIVFLALVFSVIFMIQRGNIL